MSGEMHLVTVSPDKAKEMLSNNYEHNRTIRKARVTELSALMKTGKFNSMNGQTLLMGTDGKLYDGQHRLRAIIESGVTLPMYVMVTDNPEEAYLTIDNHARRRVGDYLTTVPNSNSVAALARIMVCVEDGDQTLPCCMTGRLHGQTKADRLTIIEYAETHIDELVKAVREGSALYGSIKVGPKSGYTAFVALVRFCGRDALLSEFCKEFKAIATSNKTVAVVKNAIIKKAISNGSIKGSMSTTWLLSVLLCGYEYFLEGRDIRSLSRADTYLSKYSLLVNDTREARRGDSA